MLLKPETNQLKNLLHDCGKVILIIGAAMLVPMVFSLCLSEWQPALEFLIGALACFVFWAATHLACPSTGDRSWIAGLLTASLSWLLAMLFSAIPLFLSGHFGSYLDTCLDAISGLTTSGLTLIQDLDHLSHGMNLWRHLLMFLGGQGIVVLLLAIAVSGASSLTMYLGEARDEKIFPHVGDTARFIWKVALVYLLIGTSILWVVMMNAGMPALRGLFHSLCLFMAGYDTGGFAPQSLNVLYYHDIWVESVTMMIMLLGMINFALHYSVWSGNRKEIFRNVEIRTLAWSLGITTFITVLSLQAATAYPGAEALFRKGVFQVVSAHSSTGFYTVYAGDFLAQWTPLAMGMMIVAMGLGGSSCSTVGGIKAIRVHISFRSIWEEVKRLLSPPSAVNDFSVHHLRRMRVTNSLARGVLVITLCYLITYIGGAVIINIYGYPIGDALFESTSACANTGLSCGIISPFMPAVLKLTFIVQMWAGRLEFMSVFLLIGTIIAAVRGR